MKATRRLCGLALLGLGLAGWPEAWAQEPDEPEPKGETRPARAVPLGGRREASPMVRPAGPTRQEPRVITPGADRPAPSSGSPDRPLVELEIVGEGQPWGRIVLELFAERTPVTAANFLRYVDEGYYDGTIFHRVLPDFVIQGGGYLSLDQPKTEGLHEPIRNESRLGERNTRGTIAMARKRQPDSAVSQFYINVVNNEQLDYPQTGPAGYCVFGKVIEGMEVVDRIRNLATRVSPEAQRRFDRYQQAGQPVEQPEKSQPLNPPMVKQARRLDRVEYERRVGGRPGMPQPAAVPEGVRPIPATQPNAPAGGSQGPDRFEPEG